MKQLETILIHYLWLLSQLETAEKAEMNDLETQIDLIKDTLKELMED